MERQAIELALRVGSRICHDLVGPVGAVGNGLELMGVGQAEVSAEGALAFSSFNAASTRLKFYCIAFGCTTDTPVVDTHDLLMTARDEFAGNGYRIEWLLPEQIGGNEVQLLFLALLCLRSKMPGGGQIKIQTAESGWRISACSDRPEAIRSAKSADTPLTGHGDIPLPQAVQHLLLHVLCQDAGRTPVLASHEDGFSLQF